MWRSAKRGIRAFALLVITLGCKRGESPPASRIEASARGASSLGSAESEKPERDRRFAEIEQLVARWQELQNKRDFESYSALYAPVFRGKKRVGERSFDFDRRRWLLDRKPMFVPGLQATVKSLEVVASGANVVAVFQQEFSTPAFRDVGRKLLAFAPSADGFHIVREEMLSSEVRGGGGSVRVLPGFFFARPDGVVVRSAIDESWLTPERRQLAERLHKYFEDPENAPAVEDETFLKSNEVVLPPEVRAVEGKLLYVTRAPPAGSHELPAPCQVSVGKPVLRNLATPVFETVRSASHHDHVYGTVVFGPFDKACPGALWASETEPGKQYLPVPAPKPLLDAAKKLSPATKDFPSLTATLVGDAQGKQLLFVRGEKETPDVEPQIVNLMFALSGGVPPLRAVGVLDPYVIPRLGFDIDADGALEVLSLPQADDSTVLVLQVKNGKAVPISVYSEPDFVCPG